jgi:hypothetical protein
MLQRNIIAEHFWVGTGIQATPVFSFKESMHIWWKQFEHRYDFTV